jgi:hypothetical protein
MSRTTYNVEIYMPDNRNAQLPSEIVWTFKNATDAMLCFGGLHWHLVYEEKLENTCDIYLIMRSITGYRPTQCIFLKVNR